MSGVENVFMVEWEGSYTWSIEQVPIELLEFAEDNLSQIKGLEGCSIGGRKGRSASYALLSCRMARPPELPGRPGVVYHHAVIGTGQDADVLVALLRERYPDPLKLTRTLYARVVKLMQQQYGKRFWTVLLEDLRPVMVSAATAANRREEPPRATRQEAKADTREDVLTRRMTFLLRVNLAMLVLVLGTAVFGILELKNLTSTLDKITAALAGTGDEHKKGPGPEVQESPAVEGSPTPTPAPVESPLLQALRGGQVYVLQRLPPGDKVDQEPLAGFIVDLAQALKDTGWDVEVEVHTDLRGKEMINRTVSQRRAQLIVDEVVKRDVAPTQIRAEGRGNRQPVTQGTDPASDELNRRLVVRRISAGELSGTRP